MKMNRIAMKKRGRNSRKPREANQKTSFEDIAKTFLCDVGGIDKNSNNYNHLLEAATEALKIIPDNKIDIKEEISPRKKKSKNVKANVRIRATQEGLNLKEPIKLTPVVKSATEQVEKVYKDTFVVCCLCRKKAVDQWVTSECKYRCKNTFHTECWNNILINNSTCCITNSLPCHLCTSYSITKENKITEVKLLNVIENHASSDNFIITKSTSNECPETQNEEIPQKVDVSPTDVDIDLPPGFEQVIIFDPIYILPKNWYTCNECNKYGIANN